MLDRRLIGTLLVFLIGLAGAACEDDGGPHGAMPADAASSDAGSVDAVAAVSCNSLPNPIYLQIGDTQEPHIKDLGKRLRDTTVPGQQMTVIYVTTGSCTNIEAMYKGIKITVNPKYIPSAQESPPGRPQMASPTCTIDPAGKDIDIANSALLIDACTKDPTAVGDRDVPGGEPGLSVRGARGEQPEALTRPRRPTSSSASGPREWPQPWTDEMLYFIRTTTKSTLVALAANIQVPAARWKGSSLDQSTEVVNGVASSVSPENTIGILGAEIYENSRDKLNALAFQAYKQRQGVHRRLDGRRPRQAQSARWPLHRLVAHRLHDEGRAAMVCRQSPRARLLVDLILARPVTPDPGFDPLDIVIAKGLVPQCAMKVSRTVEGGPLARYSPPEPCHCYYEQKVGGGAPASCQACTADDGCAARQVPPRVLRGGRRDRDRPAPTSRSSTPPPQPRWKQSRRSPPCPC